ncbi:hypothetical protein [Wenxinia marina]|uniref:Uncharacterized protein n=1 Tax=Wenxinia marina DSM 24838 TaxID=1123501 RepID=A0A0D0Q207_9RHOB|nr:hypothetical protein [Wenxinia marina]KIQ68579.1 hypothetical protein Wenmar_02850 [Wenxinia marina DSM 24838]GGL67015.1 hypothetical protein GCM10011392_21930 [Wenxinia marina]
MRLLLALAAICLATAASAERSDSLRRLLDQVPQTLIGGLDGPVMLEFGSLRGGVVGVSRAQTSMMSEPEGPVFRSIPPTFAQTIMLGLDGGWRRSVGFNPNEAEAILAISAPPFGGAVFDVTPMAAVRVPVALTSAGYEVDGALFVRGGEDGSIDIENRDPADPLGGMLGRASRVALVGDLMVWSTTRDGATALATAASDGSVAARPDVAALLAALDAPEAGQGTLVRALVFADGTELMPGSGLAGPVFVADLSDGRTETALVLYVVETAQAAKERAQVMETAWGEATSFVTRRPWAEMLPEAQVQGIAFAGTGAPVVGLRIDTPTPEGGVEMNLGYQRLLSSIFARDMTWLGVELPPDPASVLLQGDE